jgi:hypothetical protein
MVAGRADADAFESDAQPVNGPDQKDLPMVELVQIVQFPRPSPQPESRTGLTTCSLCLRVLRGSEWIEAERVIREICSYELEAPPRLEPAVCELCAESIQSRGAQSEPLAA